jgi:hypothetical protein
MELLLFVRSTEDLAPACREAGKFLAFRRRKTGCDPNDDHVVGIWIHRRMAMEAPSRLALRLSTGETLEGAVTEFYGLSGIWEFGRIEPVDGESAQWGARLSRDALPDALLSLPRRGDAADPPGIFAPVFPGGTPKAQIDDELSRLQGRYPLRIARPVFHDLDTRLLSLGEE